MALTLEDILAGIVQSRKHFLKHIHGLKDDQWDWKPYPQCLSIRETLAHLVVDDRAAMQSIQTGGEPDYDGLAAVAYKEADGDIQKQLAILADSHAQFLQFLREKYAETPIDVEITMWGMSGKLATVLAYYSSEDYYHSGQVGFIRQASDPTWDYYANIYGEE